MIGEGDKVDRYSRGWEKLKEIDGKMEKQWWKV